MRLATLKHINSKNADYGAAEQYLLFEHDEFTMKPVLDETGRLIPREDYHLRSQGYTSSVNCVHPCKQSFRAVLIACPHYQSARSKKCADKG